MSPPGDTLYVCGIQINKCELTAGARGRRESLKYSSSLFLSFLLFIQKTVDVFSYVFTNSCACFLFYLFFNSCAYSYLHLFIHSFKTTKSCTVYLTNYHWMKSQFGVGFTEEYLRNKALSWL